ncbi:hypothetical protein BSKO_06858 [Bryopsis sp. KO-2023]|nr:hypothetical protein BSKO_06858 [Bryopsis sp. KO-2023]
MDRMLVLVAILALAVAARGDDSGHKKSGTAQKPNPSKCVFRNARWFCPGGGGNPPVSPQGCRCCEGPPVNTKACRDQCALVDCAPPVCDCCGAGQLSRRCLSVCSAASCPKPPTPPTDCGCCSGFRKHTPECDRICAVRFCPGPVVPPNCGCCTGKRIRSLQCDRLCAVSLCAAPVPLPVPVPLPGPPPCDCCGSGRKYAEGTNTNSLTIAGPVCNCLHVLCPQDD